MRKIFLKRLLCATVMAGAFVALARAAGFNALRMEVVNTGKAYVYVSGTLPAVGKYMTGFQLLAGDGKWYDASARVDRADRLLVTSGRLCLSEPVGVRYTGGGQSAFELLPTADASNVKRPYAVGALFSFQKELRNGTVAATGGSSTTTYYNKPLFEAKDFPTTDELWWDNLVEEMCYSGLDYVAANCRGRLPKADTDSRYERDHGDPTRIADFIAAIKRRGVDTLKIAVFDDCPASWAAARNFDKYGVYATVIDAGTQSRLGLTDDEVAYPVSDTDEIYKYIWDYNIKLAFQNFYGANSANNKYLFRYKGKPVLYLWSVNNFLNVRYAALGGATPDCTGQLRKILRKLHTDFKATFGEDLFICADRAFVDRDNIISTADVDALNNWFVASEKTTNRYSYSIRDWGGNRVGVAVPGFLTGDRTDPDGAQGSRMLFDADHGNRLTEAMEYMTDNNANLVLLEGFTDMLENAAYWRSTDTKYYDFPNQRLTILRRYGSHGFPAVFRVEAEACDGYYDTTAGNNGNQYRKGDLDVSLCGGNRRGWRVADATAGEWLRWEELPYRAGTSSVQVCYRARTAVTVRIDIDGRQGTPVELPATGGQWASVEAATASFGSSDWRSTVVHVLSGTCDLDYLTLVSTE